MQFRTAFTRENPEIGASFHLPHLAARGDRFAFDTGIGVVEQAGLSRMVIRIQGAIFICRPREVGDDPFFRAGNEMWWTISGLETDTKP